MIYDLEIKEENKQTHIDIEHELSNLKGSWFHFEIRYSGGKIVDFVVREYEAYEKLEQK